MCQGETIVIIIDPFLVHATFFSPAELGLHEAMKLLVDATPQWYNLGLELGMDKDRLNMLEKSSSDLDECFRKMLDDRLRMCPLTVQDALNALAKPLVRRRDVALRLAGEHNVKM